MVKPIFKKMLRRKKGQNSSGSPSQETLDQTPTSAVEETNKEMTIASHQRSPLPLGNRNGHGYSIAWLVGTVVLTFCAASWLSLQDSNHQHHHHHHHPQYHSPTRVFSKWDGTVVDLMPAIRQYFHVSSLLSNFSAFQRIYIVQDDSLYVADLVPHNPVDRMIGERANLTEPMLAKLAREQKLRNGAVYLVNYEDSRFCLNETLFNDTNNNGQPVQKVPILTLSRPTDCDYGFPMVTYETIRFASTRANTTTTTTTAAAATATSATAFAVNSSPPPWLARDKRIVWRGSPTGMVRIELGTFVRNYKNLFDYQLTFFLITGKKGTEFVGPDDLQKYRAVLDVDGASWSSRFASLLCLPSVVLKYDPKDVDYFYDELQPFVHYIPVTDTTDLLEKARFVQNDGNAATIANIIRNANQWCNKRLKPLEIELDMASILLDYSRYQETIDTAKLMSTQRFTKVLSG